MSSENFVSFVSLFAALVFGVLATWMNESLLLSIVKEQKNMLTHLQRFIVRLLYTGPIIELPFERLLYLMLSMLHILLHNETC